MAASGSELAIILDEVSLQFLRGDMPSAKEQEAVQSQFDSCIGRSSS